MNQAMNYEAVYRTAPATPGLLTRLDKAAILVIDPTLLSRLCKIPSPRGSSQAKPRLGSEFKLE